MKLHKIILQLSEKNYLLFSEHLKENKATKFYCLFHSYRKTRLSDSEIISQLAIKQSAFYTLKSRLYDKIQEFLYKNTKDARIELLQNSTNIEHLIYTTPRETAISILKKLEFELLEHDMSNELSAVYKALKKLHVNSPKYHTFRRCYDQQVALYLAKDKAEEILTLFCKTQSEYFLCKKEEHAQLLVFYKKELQNICNLHHSTSFHLSRKILRIQFE